MCRNRGGGIEICSVWCGISKVLERGKRERIRKGSFIYQHCHNQPWGGGKREGGSDERRVWEQSNAGTSQRNLPLGYSERPNRERRHSCRCCSLTRPCTCFFFFTIPATTESGWWNGGGCRCWVGVLLLCVCVCGGSGTTCVCVWVSELHFVPTKPFCVGFG